MTAEEEAKAKQRFFALALLRLSGAVLIAIGMGAITKGLFGLPLMAGYTFFAIGKTFRQQSPVIDTAIPLWQTQINPVRWRWIARRGKRRKALNKGLFMFLDTGLFHSL